MAQIRPIHPFEPGERSGGSLNRTVSCYPPSPSETAQRRSPPPLASRNWRKTLDVWVASIDRQTTQVRQSTVSSQVSESTQVSHFSSRFDGSLCLRKWRVKYKPGGKCKRRGLWSNAIEFTDCGEFAGVLAAVGPAPRREERSHPSAPDVKLLTAPALHRLQGARPQVDAPRVGSV